MFTSPRAERICSRSLNPTSRGDSDGLRSSVAYFGSVRSGVPRRSRVSSRPRRGAVAWISGQTCRSPECRGPELTHATHWLGALATIEKIIGRIDSLSPPVRSSGRFRTGTSHLLSSVVTRDHGRDSELTPFCVGLPASWAKSRGGQQESPRQVHGLEVQPSGCSA